MPAIKDVTLTKSKIISLLQCPKRLWLEQYCPELVPEDEDAADSRLKEGIRVGETARGLFPKGSLVEGAGMEECCRQTQKLMARCSGPLFEAAFRHKKVWVRADILLPQTGGFTLIEVKSASKFQECYEWDLAVQAWVLQGAGLDLRGIELALIDTTFVYPGQGKYKGLFTRQSMKREVRKLLPEVPGWVAQGLDVLALTKEPEASPGKQCGDPFPCPFHDHCAPVTAKYPVERLPNISNKKVEALHAEGIFDIRKVPDSFKLTDAQKRVREVTKSGKALLSAGAKKELGQLEWPRWYLDFETLNPAVPEWAGTRPYQQIPFQWSCHVEQRNGSLRHMEFLADGTADPRRVFAESLVDNLAGSGPVLAYAAGFEKRILKETAEAFPDLARKLRAISNRVFDLLPLARKYYYHRDMGGSWSIKNVLPAVAPKLKHDKLSVQNGTEAQAAFRNLMALPKGSVNYEKLRHDLLEYCELDTRAMVVLARFFAGKNPPAKVKE